MGLAAKVAAHDPVSCQIQAFAAQRLVGEPLAREWGPLERKNARERPPDRGGLLRGSERLRRPVEAAAPLAGSDPVFAQNGLCERASPTPPGGFDKAGLCQGAGFACWTRGASWGLAKSLGETPPQAADFKHAQDAKNQDDPSKHIVASD